MQTMHGCLSFISILDLIQWADNSKRSGTLVLSYNGLQKKFYFQNGKIILVDSGLNNELFDDFLLLVSDLDLQDLREKKSISDRLGLPFIGYLISENLISTEIINETIRNISLSTVMDVLKWQTGKFEFNSDIPSSVLHGPISINSSMLLMESVNKFDESRKGNPTDINHIVNKLRNDIMNGNIDLPAVPDIIQKIQKKIEDPTASIETIVNCITDQIIAAKILKICNSPYYKTAAKISTLKEAVVLIGLKTLVSIVTVHALSSFSPKNTGEVRIVLSHSLVCAMIARQIAHDLSYDYELAFTCGLLHDIGKTVMLDMLDEYMLPTKLRAKVVEDNHTEIGYLLAKKWNFGEDLLECIQYHHSPDKATTNRSMVELVYLANTMAHTSDQPGTNGEIFLSMAQCNRYSESNFKNNEIQQESVNKQIGQVKNMYKDAWDFLD